MRSDTPVAQSHCAHREAEILGTSLYCDTSLPEAVGAGLQPLPSWAYRTEACRGNVEHYQDEL